MDTATRVFPVIVFHRSLPDGRAVGKAHFERGQVVMAAGGQQLSLSYRSIQFSWGGANNRLLFASDPSHPEWSFAFSNPAPVLSVLTSFQDRHLAPVLTQLKRAERKALSLTWGILLGLLLLVGIVWYERKPIVGAVASLAPRSFEEKLGAGIFGLMKGDLEVIEDEELQQALSKFAEPLTVVMAQSGFTPKLYVTRKMEENAAALPGGYVVINRGLILGAKSPEEVLGVLAHEYAHVTERHVLKNLVSSVGVYVFFSALLGDAVGALGAIYSAGPTLLNLGFSRDHEREADAVGFEFLIKANVDPRGMISIFRRFAENEALGDLKAVQKIAGILSTHPQSQERVESLEVLAKNIPTNIVFLDFRDSFVSLKNAVDAMGSAKTSQAEANSK